MMNQPELKLTVALTCLEVFLSHRLKQSGSQTLDHWCAAIIPEIDEISERMTAQLLGGTKGGKVQTK
jgi:hypothetical protein